MLTLSTLLKWCSLVWYKDQLQQVQRWSSFLFFTFLSVKTCWEKNNWSHCTKERKKRKNQSFLTDIFLSSCQFSLQPLCQVCQLAVTDRTFYYNIMHALIWDKDISITLFFTPYLRCQQNFLGKKEAIDQVKFSIPNYILHKNKGINIFN